MNRTLVFAFSLSLLVVLPGCVHQDVRVPDLIDVRVSPQSAEEIVAWSPVIVVGTVNAISGTLTISDTIPAEWLTAEAPDVPENEWGADYTSYELEISSILRSNLTFEESDTIPLWILGHDHNGTAPTIGSSYLVMGDSRPHHPGNTIEPLGGTYGLITADDLQGPVSYAHGEKPSWAAGMTVQDLIDDIEDELDN